MADDNATRSRRRRLHGRGDHSLCLPGRCASLLEPLDDEPAPLVAEGTPAGIEAAVEAYVTALGFAETDPRAILGQIAVRLAKRVDDSAALPAAVRELRVLLGQISEVPSRPAGQLDDIRMRRALRRLDSLISSAGSEQPA